LIGAPFASKFYPQLFVTRFTCRHCHPQPSTATLREGQRPFPQGIALVHRTVPLARAGGSNLSPRGRSPRRNTALLTTRKPVWQTGCKRPYKEEKTTDLRCGKLLIYFHISSCSFCPRCASRQPCPIASRLAISAQWYDAHWPREFLVTARSERGNEIPLFIVRDCFLLTFCQTSTKGPSPFSRKVGSGRARIASDRRLWPITGEESLELREWTALASILVRLEGFDRELAEECLSPGPAAGSNGCCPGIPTRHENLEARRYGNLDLWPLSLNARKAVSER
jgi:hypothetical protein